MTNFEIRKSKFEPRKAPRWTSLLSRLLIPAWRRDDVQGDLNEMHARRRRRMGKARAWFATSLEALSIAAAFLLYRWRPRRPSMTHWLTWPELKLGLRLIGKQPVLSLVAVLTLALGIGLATSGFSMLEAMLFSRLPYENGDRFLRFQAYREPHGARALLDLERYRLFRQSASALEHVGAVWGSEVNLIDDAGQVETVVAAALTPSTLRHLPAVPLLGRSLIEDDGRLGAPPVALIRESLWKRRYDASREVLGSLLNVSGVQRTVVGVLPDSFRFPLSGEVWLPLDETYLGGSPAGPHPQVSLLGILRPGTSLQQAQDQVRALSRQYEQGHAEATQLRLQLRDFTSPPDPAAEAMGMVMVAILVVILLVVAFNVANLIRARTLSRQAELAVRCALGASRGRLVGQLFLEVAVMAALAALAGLGGAQVVLNWMNATITELPFWIVFAITPRTVLFVLLLALLAAVVAGVLPAIKSTRIDPAATLQQQGRGFSAGFGRLGAAMVVAQMALSVALLSSAMVMARGLGNYFSQVAELPQGKVLTAHMRLDFGLGAGSSRREPDSRAALRRALLEALQNTAGVEAVGAINRLPQQRPPDARIVFQSREGEESSRPIEVPWAAVHGDLLQALGAKALQGRLFNRDDFRQGAGPVAVVNRPFADRYFPAGSPLGERFRLLSGDESAPEPWIEIVGVAPDLGLSTGDPERAAGFYLPMELDRNDFFYLALRAQGDPLQLARPLRTAAAEIDPAIQLRRIMLLEEVGQEEREGLAGIASALTAMGAAALLLSVMGIYAIMSFTVTSRTREIGIRRALGAARRQILWTVAGRALALLAAGALLGCLLGAGFVRARSIFVFRFPDAEWWIFAAVLALMSLTGLIACWIPTARALKIPPTEALSR